MQVCRQLAAYFTVVKQNLEIRVIFWPITFIHMNFGEETKSWSGRSLDECM